ncbi:MAG: hypothetical protein GX780_08120 [Campylobacteraceae bacterium]|nr:hypothetical protein [Campylobacteraceae bacterium]
MSKGGWSCPECIDGKCLILKKVCTPGEKGCVLYGKALFSSQESPSNEAFEKRMERKMNRLLQKE